MIFKDLKNKTQTFLIIQSIGMLMGASTHLIWIIESGFLSEKYDASLFSKIFWDSLVILDPAAALLLIVKPKLGIYLTLMIITFDILHNNIFYFNELYINPIYIFDWVIKYWMIIGQVIFGIFVYITFKSNLKEIKLKSLECTDR